LFETLSIVTPVQNRSAPRCINQQESSHSGSGHGAEPHSLGYERKGYP
jgi:hypothetical protein